MTMEGESALPSASNHAQSSSRDLTHVISEYMDRHMVIPLIEFLLHRQLYPVEELMQAKYDLLSKTTMVDYANEVYKEMHPDSQGFAGYEEKRTQVITNIAAISDESAEVMEIIQNPLVIQQLKQDKGANLQFLKENFNFRPEMLSVLYSNATSQYAVGNYSGAAEMLYHFRILSTDNDLNTSALWGKLAAEILCQNWETAIEDLLKLREVIDARSFTSHLQQLQQRTWLIHWSLFVYFNHDKGRDGIIDLFFQPAYMSTIQTSCPWILRYLTTAVITNKKRRNVLKDLVKVIQQESNSYSDPITEFVEALYVRFDFDEAQKTLKECDEVLSNDFFLVATRDDFIENARLFIFETYCEIHQTIEITGLAERLNMDVDEAEKWVVNLIRNARMDAKIDAKTNTVVMGKQQTSIYQQVIERTKALSFRTSLLASNVESRERELAALRSGKKPPQQSSSSRRPDAGSSNSNTAGGASIDATTAVEAHE
ncbi:hypothetical protein SmJEL517_g02522 [Synchytrium microbalum]|uniref:Eukaryotic translation initiation factor 3 subunit E n=1 Tax=Synchytrium microbalum TaxID=1806994 RepID=A0A507C625_9FUNG|nr:uncharacterized protein SmJEL517_g02522 [Synchytrium microbalum]TPX35092.1 hypothetical protein SmJEL517_g02522 [Synchytrium microbalum]